MTLKALVVSREVARGMKQGHKFVLKIAGHGYSHLHVDVIPTTTGHIEDGVVVELGNASDGMDGPWVIGFKDLLQVVEAGIGVRQKR